MAKKWFLDTRGRLLMIEPVHCGCSSSLKVRFFRDTLYVGTISFQSVLIAGQSTSKTDTVVSHILTSKNGSRHFHHKVQIPKPRKMWQNLIFVIANFKHLKKKVSESPNIPLFCTVSLWSFCASKLPKNFGCNKNGFSSRSELS